MKPSSNGYSYKTASLLKAQWTLEKGQQEVCKNQGIVEFPVKLCFQITSEPTHTKSHPHDYLSMSFLRMTPMDTGPWLLFLFVNSFKCEINYESFLWVGLWEYFQEKVTERERPSDKLDSSLWQWLICKNL